MKEKLHRCPCFTVRRLKIRHSILVLITFATRGPWTNFLLPSFFPNDKLHQLWNVIVSVIATFTQLTEGLRRQMRWCLQDDALKQLVWALHAKRLQSDAHVNRSSKSLALYVQHSSMNMFGIIPLCTETP